MVNNKNQNKFDTLREKHHCFTFEDFSYVINNNCFQIQFFFNIDKNIYFKPTLSIPHRNIFKIFSEIETISEIESIIFNIGMVELISYWKAICPKKIVVKPFILSEKQIQFWKKLYFNGLGEFFYTNGIETNIDSFLEITSESDINSSLVTIAETNYAIIPIGGGKDSVVTLELAKKEYKNIISLILNPRGATIESAKAAGFEQPDFIEINRTIDSNLLKLNDEGYLNGHTPFSALLAFTTVLAGKLAGINNVVLSNESSANEATIIGSNVNHQYSKSLEFETDFRNYIHEFLAPNFNYYSYLRPLSELQIAALFAIEPKYHNIFKSCNAGSKTNSWCCNCPKCLFTFTILSPFLENDYLCNIYGENLFEKQSMITYLRELTGMDNVKPFECVGTTEEVNIALCETIKKWYAKKPLPLLLNYFKNSDIFEKYKSIDFKKFMLNFDKNHFLNDNEFANLKIKIEWILSKY